MAVTTTPYGKFLQALGTGAFNFGSDTLKVLLTTASYTPNVDTHEFLTDVTNEVTGTGYTAGGVTLASVTWTYDGTNHRAVLGAANPTWSTATISPRLAVVYKSTGTAATSRLIGVIDFGTTQSVTAEDFIMDISASGLLRLKVVAV